MCQKLNYECFAKFSKQIEKVLKNTSNNRRQIGISLNKKYICMNERKSRQPTLKSKFILVGSRLSMELQNAISLYRYVFHRITSARNYDCVFEPLDLVRTCYLFSYNKLRQCFIKGPMTAN